MARIKSRTETIQIRVTPEEKALIKIGASFANATVTDWIKFQTIGVPLNAADTRRAPRASNHENRERANESSA